MTPERAEEVLKLSLAGRYVAACGPAGEEAMALKIISEQRDAALLQIEESKKKYSYLLQSHYSLSGQITMANEIIATVQINKDEIDLKDRVAQLVERFRKSLKDSDEQLRLKDELAVDVATWKALAVEKGSLLDAALKDIGEADQRGYQRAYREHAEVRQVMKSRCVDKCSHSGDVVCDYEDGTSHCLECIAEKVWASEKRKDEGGNPWAPNKDYPGKPVGKRNHVTPPGQEGGGS